MGQITAKELHTMFSAITAKIRMNSSLLSELDGVIGDADHGITMELGFTTVEAALASNEGETDLGAIFNNAAKSFLNAVGASTGPLYATAFMRAGALLKGKTTADDDDGVQMLLAMAKGIEERGKAVPGEKTMVDAWRPAADAAQSERAKLSSLGTCLLAAADAARAGAENTKSMLPLKGRSSRLGERALGHADPGAVSAALIIAAMAESLA
ncbi:MULTISPECIES: dihydroxyacetone kinase subunit DhaL [Rhizobium/Agrobacterium group]|uniref:dihydroxyacetone kinase subunit DhaL n=2 Tax=Rhizobium/Agrobacterium group TaxID=227290 RepID=UPI00107F39C0|nr:dihydroxyacetone kinase-like protein [Agrobacterium radiobacter]MBB5588989.1 dihydroxyacetone kinase-like protein [Agrobacterium radiobacter]TGE86569.1 dihydroxyacetone kinase subunit L [Rhizobium sp. SEMIA 4032]